jgi:hypothetical protein
MTDPQVIVNLGTGGSDLNAQNGSTSSADSNDARFLDWPGDNAGNYLYCAGGSTNYPTAPDEAALDITGAIDLRIHVAMDDYSPAGDHVLFAKGTTNASSNYRLTLRTTSILQFRFGDGASSYTADSSLAVNTVVADLDAVWLRITHDPVAGEVKFYYGSDGLSWTQLGTTQSITAATPTTNNATLEIMGRGGLAYEGKLYCAQVLDGIDGTVVFDADFSIISSGSATSFTAVTGQTITINRSTSGRKSVAVVCPVHLFGTDDYWEVADNALLDFNATDSFTVIAVVRQWNTPLNNGRLIAKQPLDTTVGWGLRQNSTGFSMLARVSDGTTGVSDGSGTSSAGTLSTYGMVVDRSAQTITAYADGSPSGSPESISSVLSLANSDTVCIGRNTQSGSAYQDFELIAVAVFKHALSDTDVASVNTYYQNRAA